MYIGKVEVKSTWYKVEDLIKAQVTGQSSFAFDTDKTYRLQSEGGFGVRLCLFDDTPGKLNDGEYITGTQTFSYTPASGVYLYARVFGENMPNIPLLSVTEL